MRGLIFLAILTLAHAKSIEQSETLSAYGYNRRVAIPLGEEIRKREEALLKQGAPGRIAGGSSSAPGQIPYQAAVLTSYLGISGTGVCGGSLLSTTKIIYAAHCWFDGRDQGYSAAVVLGSTGLFFGGSRQFAMNITLHPQWNPFLIRNDVAVITLTFPVTLSSLFAPIALPSGPQLDELFDGEYAVASGYGRTDDTDAGAITLGQTLSHVYLKIITNAECKKTFPNNVVDSNICTSGAGGTSACSGDFGGPLAITRNGELFLIGIASFGSARGCTLGYPTAFSRVTSFMSFINEHL